MKAIYTIHNFAKRLVMMLAVGLMAVNAWADVAKWDYSSDGLSNTTKGQITVSYARNNGTNAVAISSNLLRLYRQNASPYNGCSATFTASSGYQITAIKVKFSGGRTSARGKIDNGSYQDVFSGGNSATVTISSLTATSYSIQNQATGSTTVTIDSIVVTYSSTCDKKVTVSNGGSSTNGSITSITTSPVATCSSTAANRQVSILVTPSTGYVAPTALSVGSTTGTVTSTKISRTDNGNGTFTFVYQYNQNDNGSISYNAACVGKQCTVTFDKNSGTGGDNSVTATYGSAMTTITPPTREHYDFAGYYDSETNNDGTGNQYYKADGTSNANWNKNTTSNTSLYAKWTEHGLTNYRTSCSDIYDIVLDDGLVATTNNGSAKVANNGTTLTNISAPTKSGYDVEGYYTTSGLTTIIATDAGALQNGSGSGITVSGNAWTNSSGQWVRGAGETFYTKWTAHNYTITYEGLEGASNTNPTSYTIETATINLANPGSRTGYTFAGWTCGGTPITQITVGSTGDKTITANWTINQHAVTVSAADHVVITATPASEAAMAEGANRNVNYNKTITLGCTPDDHWNLAWDVYKTGESSTKVAVTGSGNGATFTMPDYNVTVTAVMTEDTYHTATFKNNGEVIDGYDGVKTYDGTRPSAPTLTDVTDACDKTDCNKFYGWIAEDAIWSKTINSVAGKTIYRRAADIPNVSGADVVYHAVWAKGTAGPDISSTLLAKWGKVSFESGTAIKAKDANGDDINSITLTPTNFTSNQTAGVYCCNNSGISVYPQFIIAGLDYSDYSKGGLSFYARSSQSAVLSIWVSADGSDYGESALTTVTTESSKEHLFTINNIPKTTQYIKIVSNKNSGSFYFGTIRAYGINTSPTYDFTELTSENTAGWTTNNWDGYYIITFESSTKALLSSGIEGWYGLRAVSASSSKITTADIDLIFKVTYNSAANAGAGGYSVQGLAGGDYIATAKISEAYHIMTPTPAYLSSIDYNQILMSTGKALRYNTSSTPYRSGEYGPTYGGAPTLYKIMETFTEFRITCCDKTVTIGTPAKTGSGTVTFASGGDAYAAGDEVETCAGTTTITATVTPTNGYQCTVLSFTRSDSEDLDPDPAISVPFTGAHSYDLTFEQNADGVTLNTTVTFVALIDHYIDNMHYNTTQNHSGNYGTAPTLSDTSKGEQCTGLHYKFIGWIPEGDMNMTTGVPTTTANMVAGGATGKYATGTNYYAIWAEEE